MFGASALAILEVVFLLSLLGFSVLQLLLSLGLYGSLLFPQPLLKKVSLLRDFPALKIAFVFELHFDSLGALVWCML